MAQVIQLKDGTVINPRQVATVKWDFNAESFSKAIETYDKAQAGMAVSNGMAKELIRAQVEKDFPEGYPQMGNYWASFVTMSSGDSYWVELPINTITELM